MAQQKIASRMALLMFSDYHILEIEAFDEKHWTINWCLQHLASYVRSMTCSLYPIKRVNMTR